MKLVPEQRGSCADRSSCEWRSKDRAGGVPWYLADRQTVPLIGFCRERMKFLFVKHSLGWPRAAGHDVHGYYMMQALSAAGHTVALATVSKPSAAALNGSGLNATYVLDDVAAAGNQVRGTWVQERFRRYYGVETSHITAVRTLAHDLQADVVVAVGLEVLPYLTGVQGCRRVWYAADEWFWHHVSQLRVTAPHSWHHAKTAVVKGLYERAFRTEVDVTWVVSEADRRAMELVAGMRRVAVVRNGVDANLFQPQHVTEVPHSAVFWGRLDFGPNIDALSWFCREIWPTLQREQSDARLTIIGYQPSEAVLKLAQQDGIHVEPNLSDLRSEACRHAVTVLPFVSGGGIKNKLLEAAALGRPIVCSRVAARGLRLGGKAPFLVANSRTDWITAIPRLWADGELRSRLGEAARVWVKENHSWSAAAETAVASLTGGPDSSGTLPSS